MLKSLINRVPPLRGLAHRVLANWRRRTFKDSANYWEDRYRRGGDSGSGSCHRLAMFKAEVLNRIVAEYQIESVIEFGCGDGNQLSSAEYPRYLGMDVSATAIEHCRKCFAHDKTKEFQHYIPHEFDDDDPRLCADLVMSLDVIYHLVEDEVFETHLRHLFGTAERFVVIYSSNCDEAQLLPHVRHRRFTDFVEENFPTWRLTEQIPNRYPFVASRPDDTSKADFFIYAKMNN